MLNPHSLDGINTNPLTELKEHLTTAEPDLLNNLEELLSILVLSLTADLVSRLSAGLNQASSFPPAHKAEILCF